MIVRIGRLVAGVVRDGSAVAKHLLVEKVMALLGGMSNEQQNSTGQVGTCVAK